VLGAGIDIRGDGGYVIAPPSLHRSGRRYELANGCRQLPQLPYWLRARLEPDPPRPSPTGDVGVANRSAWARAAIEGEISRLASAQEGTRNDTLNRVAFRIGQVLASAGPAGTAGVADTLVERAVAMGLTEREARHTAQSGLAAGSNAEPHRSRRAP
jgi:hypothetical protein